MQVVEFTPYTPQNPSQQPIYTLSQEKLGKVENKGPRIIVSSWPTFSINIIKIGDNMTKFCQNNLSYFGDAEYFMSEHCIKTCGYIFFVDVQKTSKTSAYFNFQLLQTKLPR